MGNSRECDQMGSLERLDDDSGLELSLGLSCGGSGNKTKVKDALKEINSEQGSRDQVKNGKTSGDTHVKVDLCGSTAEEDIKDKKSNESVPPTQQNFWMNLGKAPSKETENSIEMHVNQVQFPGFREPWFTGETSMQGQDMSADTEKAKRDKQQRTTIFDQQQEVRELETTREVAEEKWQEARKRQKMTVEEQKQQTEGEKVDDRDDLHSKTKSGIPSQLKSSPNSANTQNGSSSENEGTADSEVEASSSRIVSPMVNYNVKQPMSVVSDVSDKKENQIPVTRTIVIGNDLNKEHNSTPFMSPVVPTSTSLPYTLPSFNVGNVPYSHSFQVPNNPSAAFSPGFSLPYSMQFVPPMGNGTDRSAVCPANSTSGRLPLGCALFQLQALEPSSWASVSHSPQPPMFGSKTTGGTRKSSDHADDELKTSQAAIQAPQVSVGVISATLDTTVRDNQKQESVKSFTTDERQLEKTDLDRRTSLSSNDEAKYGVSWSKEHASHLPMADGVSQENWNLRPGIAPGLKFGGTGNSPDLPWVTTTGMGSNGKAISGVIYRYNKSQVRIVCACHGRHMSPTEFVQHANDADVSNLDNNVVANSFPSGNQATSAQG